MKEHSKVCDSKYHSPDICGLKPFNCIYCYSVKYGRILQSSYEFDEVTINDALEILKYIAGMESLVSRENQREWYAALITQASQKANNPAITDVLEILKYLAKMDSLID